MRALIEAFSERIGSDPQLIQAAGGNVSWKDRGTLWVKSSGAWLAHAREQDMFVPVGLAGVRACIERGTENYADYRLDMSTLRPSIETALHALMPQTVVAHLHAVDAIALAVMVDGREQIERRLEGMDWMWVPYRKPGAELASQIASQLATGDYMPSLLVLANHGVVFCGEDVHAVEDLITETLKRLRLEPRRPGVEATVDWPRVDGYRRVNDDRTSSLASDPTSLAIACQRWVLYPDHAVFLGPAARYFENIDAAVRAVKRESAEERAVFPCLIVEGAGVWLDERTPPAAEAMLACYAEVCLRLPSPAAAAALSEADVSALLSWEAEAYRRSLAQNSTGISPPNKNQ